MFRLLLLLLQLLLLSESGSIAKENRGSIAKENRGSTWWEVAHSNQSASFLSESGRRNNGIAGLEFPPLVNSPLRRKQRYLVRNNLGILQAVAKGLRLAIVECKFQFQNRRWNCPTPGLARGKSLFGSIVQKGCRETAFIYAITSAGVVYTITRSCREGSMQTCSCGRHPQSPTGKDWTWGGCSDNIEFGFKYGKMFVDAAEKDKDLRHIINLHNNEAGRWYVSSGMKMECKCHGMSGTCTFKTCWMQLPQFRKVGDRLKDRFDGASQVSLLNQGSLKQRRRLRLLPQNPVHKAPARGDLVYYEASPDFCSDSPDQGGVHTRGRTCNATGLGVDGCDIMCCGRGHVQKVQRLKSNCNCIFHWCCYVECRVCSVRQVTHICL